jgi:3-oxoacyl-[acyl-carrier-protein] synthase-3
MGTTIDRVHVSTARWRHRRSALGLADVAVRRCLEEASVGRDEVDLLLNAGLYRDRNLGEPALAALIQDDVRLNAEDPNPHGHGTFSFDVANGSCGPLTALQVADGFLRDGAVRRAVVVASDADPGRGLAPRFPFSAAGAAALCSWQDGDRGVGPFRWVLAPDTEGAFEAVVRHEVDVNRLRVTVSPTFATDAAAVAAKVADEAVGGAGMAPSALDAVVVAPGDRRFVVAFADALGVPDDIVVHAADPRMHTASFLAALATASRAGRLRPGAAVLLVAAGAGITAGACLYRP